MDIRHSLPTDIFDNFMMENYLKSYRNEYLIDRPPLNKSIMFLCSNFFEK